MEGVEEEEESEDEWPMLQINRPQDNIRANEDTSSPKGKPISEKTGETTIPG